MFCDNESGKVQANDTGDFNSFCGHLSTFTQNLAWWQENVWKRGISTKAGLMDPDWEIIQAGMDQLFNDYCRQPNIITQNQSSCSLELFEILRGCGPRNVDLKFVGTDAIDKRILQMLSPAITDSLVPVHLQSESNNFFNSVSVCLVGEMFCAPWIKYAIANEICSNRNGTMALASLTGLTPDNIVKNVLSNDNSPNDAVILKLSDILRRNINILYFDQCGNIFDFLNLNATPEKSSSNPDVYIGCLNGIYFPFIKRDGEKVPPTLRFTAIEKYAGARNENTDAEIKVLLKTQEEIKPLSGGGRKTLVFHTQTITYAYSSLNPDSYIFPFINEEHGMFAKCEDCFLADLPFCEHSRDISFSACDKFKNRMKRTMPCASAHDVTNIDRSYNIGDLCDVFAAFQVAPDGNCFYAAVSVSLIKDPCLGKCLRQASVLEFYMNHEINQLLATHNIPTTEVLSRAKDGVWANNTSMYIISSVISKRIVLFHLTPSGAMTSCFYDANATGSTASIYLFLKDHHFYPLIPLHSDVQLPVVKYTPGTYRHGNDEYFKSLCNDKGCVGIIELSDESDITPASAANLSNGYQLQQEENDQTAKECLDHFTALPNLSSYETQLAEPLMYFHPSESDFKLKLKMINNIVCGLQNYDSEVTLKIINLETQLLDRKRRLKYMGSKEKVLRIIGVSICQCHEIVCLPMHFSDETVENCKQTCSNISPSEPLKSVQVNEMSPADDINNQLAANSECRIMGRDGRYKPNIEIRFQRCLQTIGENIKYIYKNAANTTGSAEVKRYIQQCLHSRSHWVEKAPPGVKLKKHQLELRDKHSKVLFKLLKKSTYQQKFNEMLISVGAKEFVSSFQKPETMSKQDTSEEHDSAHTTQNQEQCLSVNEISLTNYTAKENSSPFNNESSSEQRIALNEANEELVGRQAIADVLNVEVSDLDYEPPSIFDIVIKPEDVLKIFDFTTDTFLKRQWAKTISHEITMAQGACSFKAQRQPIYHVRRGFDFAILEGKCGCGVYFTGHIKHKPVKGDPLQISFITKGSFHLIQPGFTGRPITGNERVEIGRILQHVKAEAVFLENMNHLSALRLLHGNHDQASRETLRKIKSQKKCEERLDPDHLKDIMLQKEMYLEKSNPKSAVKGYIQYCNPHPGSFKIILFDQGSLSLHVDQVSKGGTICYLDATGGILPKMNGKEILFYSLLGKRVDGCAFSIADMLSEKGTIVEVSDFLKRVKQGFLQIRPSLKKALAELVIVDWSWPLLHAVANSWNTESIQDYLTRSYSVLSATEFEWGNKSCIFICTSHLVNATYRLLTKQGNLRKEDKSVIPYALASIARLQECYSLEELRVVTADITRLFGQKQLSSASREYLCNRLKDHKNVMDLVEEDNTELHNEDDAIMNLVVFKAQTLLREQSPFFHIFKMEKDKQLEIKEDGVLIPNPFFCPVVLEIFEKHKIAMFPFWAAAVPRKVIKNSDFLRETNSTVESSFNQMKNLHSPNGRVPYPDFVRRRYEMHAAKNKDTVSKLIRHQLQDNVCETPTQLMNEMWKRKAKKSGSHFSPKTPQSISRLTKFSISTKKNKVATNSKPSQNEHCSQLQGLATVYPRFGIPNIGQTCYFNAAVQLVLSLPSLSTLRFESCSDNVPNVKDVLQFLRSHVQMEDRRKCMSRDDALKIVKYVNLLFKENKVSEYEIGVQHDATEFLQSFLNLPDMKSLKDQFKITLLNQYWCSSCGFQNNVTDTTDRLNFDIQNGFESGIEAFLNKPEISDCSNCKANTFTNCVFIENKPNLLLVATNLLKGRKDQQGNYVVEKAFTNNCVLYTLDIDGLSYYLHGVICHRGSEADIGHFLTCLVKNHRFLCCDDQIIYEVDKPRGDIFLYMFIRKDLH